MSRARCGWCLTGHHPSCRGVLAGKGPEPLVCACECDQAADARRRVSEGTWVSPATLVPLTPSEFEEDPKECSRRYGSSCLCCGEPTRGGKFLPGHDSRYLKARERLVRMTTSTVEQEIEKMQERGLSEALQAKFRKRFER